MEVATKLSLFHLSGTNDMERQRTELEDSNATTHRGANIDVAAMQEIWLKEEGNSKIRNSTIYTVYRK